MVPNKDLEGTLEPKRNIRKRDGSFTALNCLKKIIIDHQSEKLE